MTSLRVALREYVAFENALASQIASFCAERSGVSIECVPMDLHTLYRELISEDGLRSGRWDLALLITDWLPECIGCGMIEDLDPFMRAQPIPDWPAAWPRSLTEPLIFGRSLYCIPWHDGPECLIYRRDLFESPAEQAAFRDCYGYELAPPRTWAQFEDVARFFTRPSSGLYGTAFACFPDGHNTLYDFVLQVWSRGGELQDAAGRPTLMTPQSIAALDFYRRIVRDPALCHPASVDADSVRSGELFLSGGVACMVNWFGFAAISGCSGAPLEGRVSLAPIPSAEGADPVSLSAFWSFAVAAGSRHKQAAWDFLRFVVRPEMDLEVVRHGAVGVRLSTWRDPAVRRANPAYESIEAISAGARRLPRTPTLPAFAAIINTVIEGALQTEEPSRTILERAQQQAIDDRIQFL